MRFGFGVQPWLRDNHLENFWRMLDEMSLVGLDGFETSYPFVVEWFEHHTADLRAMLAMHDLELASYYTGCAFRDRESLVPEIAEVERRCRFVAEVGGHNVLLDGGRKLPPDATPQEIDARIQLVAETANRLGAYARALGLTLSWHQHWGSLFEVEAHLDRLLALTDPAVVRFCPDVAQLALSGMDVCAVVKRYAARIGFVHYKDITFAGRPQGELWPGGLKLPADEGGYNVDSRGRFVELGRGVVPFQEVTAILRGVGYDGWLVDDFDFTGYPARASAQACKDYVNQGLGIWTARDVRRGLAPQPAR
jgi:inosose dehydratase